MSSLEVKLNQDPQEMRTLQSKIMSNDTTILCLEKRHVGDKDGLVI